MNSPGANDSVMNRLHLPVRERLAGANAASIADSFVPLKALSSARSRVRAAVRRRRGGWLVESPAATGKTDAEVQRLVGGINFHAIVELRGN